MNKNRCAMKPPMGWNSWNCYGASVNEGQLMGNAEYMAKHLKQYGWDYVVCDIQWSEPNAYSTAYNNFTELEMDEYSRLIPAVKRFPSAANGAGFKPIADKIHALGLKFGIHIMRGIPRQAVHRNTPIKGTDRTARQIASQFSVCPWNTDMYGIDCSKEGAQEYYNSIFELYASWDVDFIKVDDICNTEFNKANPYSAAAEIEAIRKAIDNCGRDMVLSLSPGPASLDKVDHMSENANMWRMTGDFWDEWDKLLSMFERCSKWYPHVKEGCWPDCDMLPLGKIALYDDGGRPTRFTKPEQVTVMTLWSVFRSPLIFGGELTANDDWTLSLITNKEVIDVNQNAHSAHPVLDGDEIKVWTCTSEKETCIAAVFNVSDEVKEYSLPLELFEMKSAKVHNLWTKDDLEADGSISLVIEPHGAVMLELS